jgi:hypothetical protein
MCCARCASHTSAFSRHDPPEFCKNISPWNEEARATFKRRRRRPSREGAGNAGCPKHPQPVCKGSKHTVVTTGTPGSTGIPCTMVFNGLLRDLPGDEFVFVTVVCGFKRTARPGWGSRASTNLTLATGARTTRLGRPQPTIFARILQWHVHIHRSPGRSGKRRSFTRRSIAHGPCGPPCHQACATTLPRPPHLIPTFVTIMIRPSLGMRRERIGK